MEVTGNIKKIGGTEQVTEKFKKRNLVVTTAEQYPQDILIEFIQDKTTLLDALRIGENVTVAINLRGREWTSPKGEVKYFNSLHGWRITPAQKTETPPADEGDSDGFDL